VTEREEGGGALDRLHGAELETILTAIGDPIMIFDRDGRIVMANRAATQLFGLQRHPELKRLAPGEQAERLQIRDAEDEPMPYDALPTVRALRGETLAGENAVDLRFTSHRGREVEMNVTAAPIVDQSGEVTGAVCVYRDVTNRRGLERTVLVERDRLRIVLNELRAVEAKRDEFLSSLSHDLKNPLTGLRGLAQLVHRQLTTGTLDRESTLRHLESMIQSTGTMTRMVDDLVRASRQRADRSLALECRPVDLVALTRSFVAAQQPVVDQDIILEAEPEQLVVPIDIQHMERVISNLVWNAIKYSSRQSRVWVRLGIDGPCAILSVRDEGIGIPADEMQHIFERYYRARNVSPEVPGTGVGLVSALEIVQAHGGSLTVESEEGQGSTFTVRLPLGV
jgi:PAS domain S-box-containing protein